MAWITTKNGKRINTDWFDDDAKKKDMQIEASKKEAEKLNNKEPKEESIKGTPMIFATAITRGNRIIIDGYSKKKTEKGALQDLARAVEKYSKQEADNIRDMIKFNEMVQFQDDNYGIEWEEVSQAIKPGKTSGEDEYKEAKWYLHTYFWKE